MKTMEQHNRTISKAEEAAYQTEETMSSVHCLILGSIISADNDQYTEEQKQEIITRYNKAKETKIYDWRHILEPIDETGRLAELFKIGE